MPYWKSYSSDMGRSWGPPQVISKQPRPPGCARPWLLRVGETLLLSGGRMRNLNTTDILLWVSADGGNTWAEHSISGVHNSLVRNETYAGYAARFGGQVNATAAPRTTSSYTSLFELPR